MTKTPILDLEKDPPKAPSLKWWFALGIFLGLVPIAMEEAHVSFGPGFNIFIWVVATHVVVGLHELGHTLVARFVGMPLGGIKVGCFQWLKSGARWVFRFDVKCWLGGMMIPLPPRNGFSASDFAWIIAAGPIVSLASILGCGLLWLRYGDGSWDWIGSSLWASAIGIFSLIPMSGSMSNSDASRLLQLWKNPRQAETWMALVGVTGENLQGVRPRDWTPSFVERIMAEPADTAGRVSGELFCYCHLLDKREEESSLIHLEKCLAASGKAGKPMQQILYLEAAAVSASMRQNVVQARTWQDRARKLGKPEFEASANAAIAACEGRYEEALRDIEAARQYIRKRNPGSGIAIFALERLGEREQECRQALSLRPATTSASG